MKKLQAVKPTLTLVPETLKRLGQPVPSQASPTNPPGCMPWICHQ